MTPSLAPEIAPEIQVVHDRIMTTSLAVSKAFGKDHKNVLRDIQNLECPKDFHALNFEPMFIEVKIGNGAVRKDPAFLITRDGFTILAMGFTGKQAMEFKIRYIEAFNRMEEELRRRKEPPAIPQDSPRLTFIQKRILSEIVTARSHLLHFDQRDPMMARMWQSLKDHFRITSLDDLPAHLFEAARSFLETFPVDIPETRPPGIPYDPRSRRDRDSTSATVSVEPEKDVPVCSPVTQTEVDVAANGKSLDLNFPKDSARPSRSFWKDLPPDSPKDGLSVQDLLDPDYPDPLRQLLERIEKAGYDVQGPWTQYQAMKGHLRSCSAAFTEIYQIARVRRIS